VSQGLLAILLPIDFNENVYVFMISIRRTHNLTLGNWEILLELARFFGLQTGIARIRITEAQTYNDTNNICTRTDCHGTFFIVIRSL
jgi:hypothetical protein